MFAYVWTCNSFDYRKMITDVKLHRIEKKNTTWTFIFHNLICCRRHCLHWHWHCVCNLADKKPIWAEDIKSRRKKHRIRSSLYNPIECTNIFRMVWAHRSWLFFSSRRHCSVIYHERAMCIHVPLDGLLSLQLSRRFVAWNCIRSNLYARK